MNGSTANFSCFFEVKSKDKKPFNITVVEQGEIKPKQYKLVDDGYINGQIDSDGQLKSYFLVLKAQHPCECDVRIALKPKDVHEQQQAAPSIHSQTQPTPQEHGHSHHSNLQPQPQPQEVVVVQKEESYFQMKYIVGLSIALIILYLLYKYRKTILGKFLTKDTVIPSVSNTSF